jgi:hypothetical protein
LKEIEEVLIQALPYVGYPAIATALAAAAEVIKEYGLDGGEKLRWPPRSALTLMRGTLGRFKGLTERRAS